VKGVVTLNEDWELEDFCNTEQVEKGLSSVNVCLSFVNSFI